MDLSRDDEEASSEKHTQFKTQLKLSFSNV